MTCFLESETQTPYSQQLQHFDSSVLNLQYLEWERVTKYLWSAFYIGRTKSLNYFQKDTHQHQCWTVSLFPMIYLGSLKLFAEIQELQSHHTNNWFDYT